MHARCRGMSSCAIAVCGLSQAGWQTVCVHVFRPLISLEPWLSPITSQTAATQAGWLMSAGCTVLTFFFFFSRSRLDCRRVFHSFSLSVITECFQLITCSFFTVGVASECNEYQNYLLVHTLLTKGFSFLTLPLSEWLWILCAQGWWQIIFLHESLFCLWVLTRGNVHNSHHWKLIWGVCVFNWTGV